MEENISCKMNSKENDDYRSSDEESEEEEIMNNPIYDMMKDSFNTICLNKYELFLGQYRKFCKVMSESENEEDFLENLTFEIECIYEDYIYKSDLLISDVHTPNLKKYVELLMAYDGYNKNYHILVALKNKTKLNNDIIFNLIIKYL